MAKTLFIGDINVDVMMGGMESLPIVDREVICESYDVVMGASTVLCCCAYGSLGGDVSIAGLTGRDDYGDFMVKGLNEFGVNTDLVRRTDKVRTGVTVNLIYESTRTQVTYPGTIAAFDGADIDESTLRGFDHVHFGGVYIQTRLRPEITRILKIARDLGMSTSIDPQWDSSEKWEGMDEWLPLVNYLFVNKDEAISIARTGSVEEACRQLSARTRCALVKNGEQGALFFAEGNMRAVPGFRVTVQDTTGAGDSFDAGFLFATMEKKMEIAEACRFANAVAARSCMFVGGVAARSRYEDILRFYSAIR